MIGGTISKDAAPATLIDPEADSITSLTRESLWEIMVAIGHAWGNLEDDSVAVRSSWLEFIRAKVEQPPSYAGEYQNAVAVLQELKGLYGDQAFHKLFFEAGIPPGPPVTRLAHAKHYVVDELIRMQVVASGFRGFARPSSFNYKGFVGGSRYNRLPRVRRYEPEGTARGDAS